MSGIDRILARRHFREMKELERLIEAFGERARIEVLAHAERGEMRYPIYSVEVGSTRLEDPVLAFFGGVHGLEKIGSEVILAYMDVILQLLSWDEEYRARLSRTRLLFVPIVNPIGVVMRWRSNGNGVDLMRNSPIDAESSGRRNLYNGHRISPLLPWYRGPKDTPMEVEAQALCTAVRNKVFPAKVSLVVDIHSGFGANDRLWFPYSHTRKPYRYVAEVTSLKKLFDRTYPHHFYKIEPTSDQYLIDGDLWDYLALDFDKTLYCSEMKNLFIPWTLEMGSWIWLRKNPRQALSKLGLFHPMQPHRHHRIMRRHITLFDFLHRALMYPSAWLNFDAEERQANMEYARQRWYGS